jgi:aerobic carbon-monoxide dehydrogenase large subunit
VTLQVRRYGESPRRTEDPRLLTGRGCFTDDLVLPRMAHAVVVRSLHAHANILSIDAKAARSSPGVLAVLTGADIRAAGLGFMPCISPQKDRDGRANIIPPYPLLQDERARFVGDCIAFVVAETRMQARDAAERVAIRYEPLPAVITASAALAVGAPTLWDEAPGNLCLDFEVGDKEEADRAFANAAHVTRLALRNNRVVVASMEPRGSVGEYDVGRDAYTLHVGCQGAHNMRMHVETVLKARNVRVLTRDVGGGFGMKTVPYPEYMLCLWAARLIGRPVKWIGDRGESFLSDAHARDQETEAALALDKDGRILAIRVETAANMGAYLSAFAPEVPTMPAALMHGGVYGIPVVHVRVRCAFTNTTPVEAYRGSGRPEAAYTVERLVDQAAREMTLTPAELRRRNVVPPHAFPYRTVTGLHYDSAEYDKALSEALRLSDWEGFARRRDDASRHGRLAGIGLAVYTEICGIGGSEHAKIKVDPSGAITIAVGTQSTGQGHETAWAQIAADLLHVPMTRIRVIQGDTDTISYGRGTGGSRSLQITGPAVQRACTRLVAKMRKIAAHMLESAEADIAFDAGRFVIAGTDRAAGWNEVVARAFQPGRLPPEIEPGLVEQAQYAQEAYTFPNGCHVAEVEIDRETGRLALTRYTAVDDFGRILNPMLVEGQVHGSLAQGLGQALLESVRYDGSGQLLSGSFMDYALPRAADFPAPALRWLEVPSPANPLGTKGCAEAGCVGGPPAVMNAIADALLGARSVDMPALEGLRQLAPLAHLER